jgi:RimJ/RimL family protein N-acetyltransferase
VPHPDDVRLQVLDADSEPGLVAAVLALRPLPEQEEFAGCAAHTLPAALVDPGRTAFAVVAGGEAVGFGVLDRGGSLAELVDEPARAVLLRGFYVGAGHQGHGYGTRAARACRALATAVSSAAELVVLTVNERNPAAHRVYARAGFVDTGARYLGGDAGPQRVMVAAASPGPPAAPPRSSAPRAD